MNKRGNVAIYVTWFLIAVILVTVASVLAPMGVMFNTEMYEAGEDILQMTEDDINDIDDVAVRTQIQDGIDSAQAEAVTNINNLNDIFQYGWVIVLVLSAIVVFIFSRRLVEYGAGGFV